MAEALRYRDLARPSLIDTNVVDDGSVARLNQLANTFKAFETTASNIGGQLAANRGAAEGAAAGASGNPQLKSDLRAATSKYAAAYNNAATRSYLIKAEADVEDTSARLEAEAGTNAAQFGMSFDKVRQQTLAAAPAELRSALDEMFVKRRGDALARIDSAAVVEQNKFAREDLSEGVARSTDRIANLRASDDPAKQAQAEEEDIKLGLLIDGAVNDGTISAPEAMSAHINAQRSITAQTVVSRFRRELDNPYGNPVAFIQRLKEANKTSEALPPDQEDKLTDMLLAELRERNSLASAADSAAADARRQRWMTGNRDATSAYLSGTLRQPDLQKLVEDDNIDPDTARTILSAMQDSPARAKSDPSTLMDFEVNLLDKNENDILGERGLTPADKSRLVLKLRDEANGWRGSVPGREAADRIDRALGLVPGSIMNAALSDTDRTKRERAMTDWYNSMVALPPEEREGKAIDVAEQVITRTIRAAQQTKVEELRARRAALVKESQAGGDLTKTQKREFEQALDSIDRQIQRAEQQGK